MENIEMNTINFDDVRLSDSERQPCEVWTRVMGYHRPFSEFNKGKKSEFKARVCYSESKALREDSLAVAAE